ncbi:YihY/virulence factor BrkB family protein [Humibacter sp. BT305]|nr:YihY/virulence factor BrkB family protein [Humibacter sp. BT305]
MAEAERRAEDPQVDDQARLTERIQDRLQERFQEPIETVTRVTERTLALFPVRVWRRFLVGNGFVLSAGMSYQALFAVFAGVYVVFAVAGIWLVQSPETMDALIDVINTYVPGLIGDEGVITTAAIREIATSTTSVLTVTGLVAVVILFWTATSWITYSRLAMRSIFRLPRDERPYVLLKARDFLVALAFGLMLLFTAVLSVVSTAAVDWLLDLVGVETRGWIQSLLAGAAGLALVFVVDTAALVTLFRFLARARIRFRRMLPGAFAGAFALVLLQAGGGRLLSGATQNPLLSSFVVFIAMLLWFRIISVIALVAGAWIAVAVEDRGEELYTEAERALLERDALLVAARVRVREAEAALAAARWWQVPLARRRLDAARRELDELLTDRDRRDDAAGRPAAPQHDG